MTVKRTPEARVDRLENWPYGPQYLTNLNAANGIRVHYVDVGKVQSDRVFLCLHGQPTWAYLYRKMIPVFAASGARMVAPDQPAFGRSDKPVAETIYGFGFYRQILLEIIDRLNLHNIKLVVQDWGGLLGLTLPMDRPDQISRLLVMNNTLAIGHSAGEGFDQWLAYCQAHPDLNISRLMQRTCPNLTLPEAQAYDARRDPRLPSTTRNCQWRIFFTGMGRASCRGRLAQLGNIK